MKLFRATLISLLAMGAFTARSYAQIQTAGALLVNIDATTLPLGPILGVPNSGSTGGYFSATGLTTLNQPVIVSVGGGANGIMFSGSNFMQQTTTSNGSTVIPPAFSLVRRKCPVFHRVLGGEPDDLVGR